MVPYYALLSLTLISQIPVVKEFCKPYKFGFSYPATVTTQGYAVAAEKSYAAIGLFSHPAPIITLASLIGLAVYMSKGSSNASAWVRCVAGYGESSPGRPRSAC
jgi:lactate permease